MQEQNVLTWQRRQRYSVVALVVLLAALLGAGLWLYRLGVGESEAALRHRLESSAATARLTTWALETMEQDRQGLSTGGIPNDLRQMGAVNVHVTRQPTGEIAYLGILFSSGMRAQGVFVGPKGFRPKPEWPYQNQWSDHLWYFEDRYEKK